ncbi:meiotic recombination protein REC8 homolog [Sardina pilchardus]|uniref:meiotic recombination protein REC8 homolog n=1 Tax=Sardina pilchardus TaxID=27697 RepID=UPI002E124355
MVEADEISEERTPMSVPLPSPSSVGSRPREERVRQRIESPSLEVLELPPIVRRRRRRQLIFADERTQIPEDEQRAQIDNVHVETRPLAEVLVDVQTPRTATADALLSNPCNDLTPDILEIWRRGAALRSSPAARGEVETSEEEQEERELGRTEMEEGRIEVEQVSDALEMASDRELSSKDISAASLPHPETLRELERSLSQEGSGVHSLELSDRDMSQQEPVELPRSPVQPVFGRLEDIPEEIPEPFEAEVRLTEDELRMFFQPLEMQDEVTFQSLLPPSPSRETVAGSFWCLLENVNRQRVIVHQDEPYGDIFVSRGLLFDQIW